MKVRASTFVLIPILLAVGRAETIKIPPPPQIELKGATPHGLTAGLLMSSEVREYVYEAKLQPLQAWGKRRYPMGAQTVMLFEKNLPSVFKQVVAADSRKPGPGVDLVIEPSIVKFEAISPMPVYKPYVATMVYRVDVYDREGNKLFTQTATGNGQISKGMASGFSVGKLCAQSAQLAALDAAKQVLEGLLDAVELKNYK